MRGATVVGTFQSRAPAGVWLCATLLLVLTAYSNSLAGPFIWDDHSVILEDPSVVRPSSVLSYFSRPFWGEDARKRPIGFYYRPLVKLSYAIDFRLWGPEPTGFHATNLLVHLANVALVFFCSRTLAAPPALAALAAAGWGVFPRLTESVTWISGRTDVLACGCILAAFLFWRREGPGGLFAALTFLAAGLLFKETTAAAFPALAVLELARLRRHPEDRRRAVSRLAGMVGLISVYFVARSLILVQPVSAGTPGLVRRLMLFLQAAGTYATMIADPFHPRTGIGNTMVPVPGLIVIGAILVPLAAAGAVRGWRRWRPETLAFACFGAGALALVLHVVSLPGHTVACDRFLYLPLAGFTVAVAGGAGSRGPRERRLAALALGALAVPFAIRTYARNADWGSELRFWVREARSASPGRFMARDELASVFFREGRFEEAARLRGGILAALRRSDSLDREARVRLEGSIALCLSELGRYDEARRLLERLDDFDSGFPEHRFLIARLEMERLDFNRARADVELLLSRFSAFGRARALRAAIDDAERQYASLPLHGTPEAARPDEVYRRAQFFESLGRRPGVEAWGDVVRSPESGRDVVLAGARYLLRFGSIDEARRAVATFEKRFPSRAEAPGLARALRDREARERELDAAAREFTG